MRPRALTDLTQLRQQLAQHQRETEAREAAQRAALKAAQARAMADHDLFARAVGPVRALASPPRVVLAPAPPAPLAIQHMLDEAAVLHEAMSDEFDVSTLLDTDDHLSFRRPGIGTDVTRRLRRGEWRIQRELDLHGLRTHEARAHLAHFIGEAFKHGLRCVRVVHGKGLGSPDKTPVLKSRVQGWLVQKKEVLAFVQARPAEGGAGALVVLLSPSPGR
jgi:DNA-nicking Smr family endonuclease